MASKSVHKVIEKLQDEKKRLETSTECEKEKTVHVESRIKQDNILELLKKVHELEKENKSLQQKGWERK